MLLKDFSTASLVISNSSSGCVMYLLDLDLNLDKNVAEPFSIYAMGESWEYLFSPRGRRPS